MKKGTILLLSECQAFHPAATYAAPKTRITDLTTEYLTEPLGIETDSIHFGWKMESNVIGKKQTAYQIQVYKMHDGQQVWDSQKITQSQSTGIEYGGTTPLEEGTAYSWNVIVWDEKDAMIFSESASFETGVSNQEIWKNTQFIRVEKSSFAPIFRTEQGLRGEVAEARLYITALGAYQVYINGAQVGTVCGDGKVEYDHMNPGYGNRNYSLGYQTYDVTGYLQGQQTAAVSVLAGNGWNAGAPDDVWAHMGDSSGQPAVKAWLKVIYADGTAQDILTNPADWKATLDGPITANGIYYGEDYDARLATALGDYKQAGYQYDSGNWSDTAYKKEVRSPLIVNTFEPQTARYVKLTITKVDPGDKGEKRNRLQLMELELLDQEGNNVLLGVNDDSITVSNNNLTDDCGYTTGQLNKGAAELELDTVVELTFDMGEARSFQTLKMYPRVGVEPVSGKECGNYLENYSLQVSHDGGVTWREVTAEDSCIMKKEKPVLSTTSFSGEIRGQVGLTGKILEEYSRKPASITVYNGEKEDSVYPGGEINIVSTADSFGNGITLKKGETMILDMGQNMTAVPRLECSGKRGTKLTLHFGEALNDGSSVGGESTQADGPKGSLYQKNLRTARATALYTFAGNERESYMTAMSFFGYQYMSLTATGDVTIYSVRSQAVSSVSKRTGTITTNNAYVNKLLSNVAYGQMSNYYTTATDCNQRDERTAWTGDTQTFVQTAVYNFNSLPFLKELLNQMSEVTRKHGYVSGIVNQTASRPHASGWSSAEIIVPWTLYMQTGDTSIIRKNWDAMEMYMDYMLSNERQPDHAYLNDKNEYGDWLSFQGTSVEVMADAYYGYITQLMAKMAGDIGDVDAVYRYTAKSKALKSAFLKEHVYYSDGNLVLHSGDKKFVSIRQLEKDTRKMGISETEAYGKTIRRLLFCGF